MINEWCILDKLELSKVPSKPGAYMISIFGNDGQPIKISRFIGVDTEGIIDIGESTNLRKRLSDFKRNADKRCGGHMAGWRFNFLKLNEKLWTLKFSYEVCATKEEAYKKEYAMMKEYVDKHKELPPLNYKYNWSEG
ncbi:MAG: GIY-YIG nuclease family protein [Candidatus Woesearchaeota archaeon]